MRSWCLLFIFVAGTSSKPAAEPLPFLPDVYQTMEQLKEDASRPKPEKVNLKKLIAISPVENQSQVADQLQKIKAAIASSAGVLSFPVPEDPQALRAKLDYIAATHKTAVFDRPTLFQINRNISDYLYGGDILMTNDQLVGFQKSIAEASNSRQKRGAPLTNIKYWTISQKIAFIFDTSIPENVRALIRDSLSIISSQTCLNFEENGTVGTKLNYFSGDGCYSYLGMYVMEKQPISIGPGCDNRGIIMHETSHALGLDHTQNRYDRDTYVTVNSASVISSKMSNFNKLTADVNNNFGVSYDYGSDMHYAAYDFTSNGQPTIVGHDAGFLNTMGSRRVLTFSDFKMLNLLYNCSQTCPSQIECKNSGFQNPKNCGSCVCPPLFSGAQCENEALTIDLRDSSVTGVTDYKVEYNKTLYTSGNNNNWAMFHKDFPKIIRAPVGKKILVNFTNFLSAYGQLNCYAGCPLTGVEIVDGDLTTTGKLFCCTSDIGKTFVSKTNVIGYRAFASPGMPFESSVKYTIV